MFKTSYVSQVFKLLGIETSTISFAISLKNLSRMLDRTQTGSLRDMQILNMGKTWMILMRKHLFCKCINLIKKDTCSLLRLIITSLRKSKILKSSNKRNNLRRRRIKRRRKTRRKSLMLLKRNFQLQT